VRLPLIADSGGEEIPIAVEGRLDLGSWSFESNGPVKLNGGWDFYSGKFINPVDFSGNQQIEKESSYTLPGVWNGRIVNGRKLQGTGFATYRLRITIPERYSNEIISMKIPYLFTAYRMWVNGREAVSNGTVGTDYGSMVPQYSSRLYEFVPKGNVVDVVLQISNFHHNRGGLRAPILMGTSESLHPVYMKSILFDMLIFCALFIVGLYHIVLFLLRRKEQTHFLFGLICLLFSLRTGFTGETILLMIFDFIPWIVHVKIEWLSVYIGPFLLANFLSLYFPRENIKIAVRFIQLFSISLSLVTVFFNPNVFTAIFTYVWFINASIFFYFLYVIIFAVIKKREGSVIILAGYITPFLTVLNDILYAKDILNTGHFLSFGLLTFVFLYTFVLSQKNARSYNTIELLSSELVQLNSSLEEKVKVRTAELFEQKRELQEAIDNIKTLTGLIPICSSCKKIRNDKGLWDQLESYFTKHSNAEFTHGICPDCAGKLYPDIDLNKLDHK